MGLFHGSTHGTDPWSRPTEQIPRITPTQLTLLGPVVLLVSMAVQPMHEYTHMPPNHTPAPIVPPKIHIHTVQHLKYIVLSIYPLHLTKSRWHSMVQLQHVPIRAKHTYYKLPLYHGRGHKQSNLHVYSYIFNSFWKQ